MGACLTIDPERRPNAERLLTVIVQKQIPHNNSSISNIPTSAPIHRESSRQETHGEPVLAALLDQCNHKQRLLVVHSSFSVSHYYYIIILKSLKLIVLLSSLSLIIIIEVFLFLFFLVTHHPH